MKYLKTFEEISPEYIQGKINAHKASSASDTKGGQIKRLQTAVDDKLIDRANNTPEAVAAREDAEKREAEIAQMEEKIRNNPYVKRLETEGLEILHNWEPDGNVIGQVETTKINVSLVKYKNRSKNGFDSRDMEGADLPLSSTDFGNSKGQFLSRFYLEHPNTGEGTELYISEDGIYCDLKELRDVCCPSSEGWGNFQEAKQIAILGFTKATLVNLKFILRDIFGVGDGRSVMMNSKKVYDEDTFVFDKELRIDRGDDAKIIERGFPCEDFVNYLQHFSPDRDPTR